MLMAVPAAARAQPEPAPTAASAAPAAQDQIIDFSADQVTYDSDADVVTAAGEVRMSRDGNYVSADQVIWNRKTGQVHAKGNVVMLSPQEDKFIGDNVELTDTLRDGAIDNLLVVLENGARLAATHGTRTTMSPRSRTPFTPHAP